MYIKGSNCWHEVQPGDEVTKYNRDFVGTKCGTLVADACPQKSSLSGSDTTCDRCKNTSEKVRNTIASLRK